MLIIRSLTGLFILCLISILSMLLLGHIIDSNVISYTLRDQINHSDALVMDMRTGVQLSLLHSIDSDDITGRSPIWSNDGERVSFWTFQNRRDAFVHEIQFTPYSIQNLTINQLYSSPPIYSVTHNQLFAVAPLFIQSPIYLVTDDNPQGDIIIESSQVVPVWSPDGTKIAYTDTYRPPDGEDAADIDSGIDFNEIDIYVFDINTNETINLTLNTPLSGNPLWLPDGSTILFVATDNTVRHLYQIDLTTYAIEQLEGELSLGSQPILSPDGRYLAYSATVNSGTQSDVELMLFDLLTHQERNLSNSALYDLAPAWSLDSTQLAFISRRHESQDEIYVVNIPSGQVRRLTFSAEDEADVSWRPR